MLVAATNSFRGRFGGACLWGALRASWADPWGTCKVGGPRSIAEASLLRELSPRPHTFLGQRWIGTVSWDVLNRKASVAVALRIAEALRLPEKPSDAEAALAEFQRDRGQGSLRQTA